MKFLLTIDIYYREYLKSHNFLMLNSSISVEVDFFFITSFNMNKANNRFMSNQKTFAHLFNFSRQMITV
jgi:hypothetical protein